MRLVTARMESPLVVPDIEEEEKALTARLALELAERERRIPLYAELGRKRKPLFMKESREGVPPSLTPTFSRHLHTPDAFRKHLDSLGVRAAG